MRTVTHIQEKVVYSAQNPHIKEVLVLMYSEQQCLYAVLRVQELNKVQAIKNCKRRYGPDFQEVFRIVTYQNSRNLFHRFKDYIHGNSDLKDAVTFYRTMFSTEIDVEVIKSIFVSLESMFQQQINTL